MERCVYKHVYNHLIENDILTQNQSGFTRGDSAVNQLVNISNDFGKALDNGKEIRVVFCDISKAFDRVWHKGLIYKLKKSGISGNLLKWFENYLTGRSQRVVINGCNSDWLPINAGVPQGSILGPLLFLIFINDIITDIHAIIKLFADDTSLYLVVDNPIETAEILNSDLNKIHEWSKKWLVKFNPNKTETMVISKKIIKPDNPALKMGRHELYTVDSHKHLGVYFSNDGFWNNHIDYILQKAYSRINLLRKMRNILDRFTLERIYLTFIRPILEYAEVIWDTQNQSLIDKLEKVQLDAARIVTGGTKLTGLNRLYEETCWEKLTDRRRNHKLILFHKIVHNKTPQYLRDLMPNTVSSRHNHNTRQFNNLLQVNTRTRLYSDYFLPCSVRLWNNLPLSLRNCQSLSLFKKHLQSQNSRIPMFYYVGSRIGQILHARLRMNSSSFNSHLFLKNLVDSPNCTCGGLETNSHFLLTCPRYTDVREQFLSPLSNLPIPMDINTLLFGSNLLSDEENSTVFIMIQKFIIKSKRFTP